MFRLISTIVGLLASFVVGWLIPLVGIAILMPLLAITITANPTVGSVVTAIILAVLVSYHIRNRMWWQLGVGTVTLGTLVVLAALSPAWAILWMFFIQGIAVGLLLVPGAVLPMARRVITAWLIGGIILTTVLTGVVRTGGEVLLALLGLLALGGASILFSQAARPWEIRRAQRRAASQLAALGFALIVAGLLYNWWPAIMKLIP